ncbi:FkbM family methyltransferase [Lyngbya confervoides]|uniref:FkbM family methyltransferase n=1 Tax=Lyngbya confervoides BDU141951 TaxID=1574623 RepID=A0ABD4SZ40_9CYAN|nr:FkbM family methyltransferase [Lyngbya confervoides]MCM1981752.1 FkbM family methyltransferase [Lyngbya confervoides BDU141951]
MQLRSQIRNYLVQKLDVPEIPGSLKRLAAQGFQPQLIFDVGAYRGDFAQTCLEIWPQSEVACFEALSTRVQDLQALAREKPSIRVFAGLVGAHYQEKVQLHEAETASSVLVEQQPQGFPVSHHTMRPLDQIVQENYGDRPPELLKIDVQGYELEVLKGAEQTLPSLQAILAEVNLIDIHQGVSLFAETVHWLHERGWGTFDICELHRRPLDQALWQVDVLFVPYCSPLRADKRWGR